MVDMARIKITTLVLASVLSLCGVAAGTALASPKGELVNKEGKALVHNKYKSTFGAVVIETTAGFSVKCTSGTGSGTITSTTAGLESVTLVGCKSSAGGTCHSSEAAEGVIKYIEQEVTQLHGEEKIFLSMKILREWECGSAKIAVSGAYLTPVSVEGKLATKYTYTASEKGGVQTPTEYVNSKEETVRHTLEIKIGSEKIIQAGISAKEEITFEEEAEYI